MTRQYFTASMDYVKPEPRHRLCMEFADKVVTLQQRAKDNFAVRYGKQVDADLTYSQACCKLGQALMHYGACESMLDNRTRDER